MNAKDLYERVCATLEADTRRLWGRIQDAEDETCARGTISRYYNGSREISLKTLLDFFCAAGIDPSSFFARAIGRPLDAQALLGDLIVDHRTGDRIWREVESATRELERVGDLEAKSAGPATPPDIEGMVEDCAGASRREQMRRLRTTERYRNPEFARAYLKHLDALRLDDPESTYRLVARVAINLIPAIPGTLETRVELQCEALGIFGSAVRLREKFSSAARALFLAVQLTERHQLSSVRGRILHRSAHLLENTGNAELALLALREAIEIYVHADSGLDLGKTLIIQGRILCCVKEYEKAVLVLEQGLVHLPEELGEFRQYHFSAFQCLAEAHHHLGDTQRARMLLAKASTFIGVSERVRPSSLEWQEGNMRLDGGNFVQAEELIGGARAGLRAQASPAQEALVTLDLVDALFKQGKHNEASKVATSTARFLEPLEGDDLAEAAILALARAGIQGRLTRQLLNGVRRELEQARPEARAR